MAVGIDNDERVGLRQVDHAFAQEVMGILAAQTSIEILWGPDVHRLALGLQLLQQQVHDLHVARRLFRQDHAQIGQVLAGFQRGLAVQVPDGQRGAEHRDQHHDSADSPHALRGAQTPVYERSERCEYARSPLIDGPSCGIPRFTSVAEAMRPPPPSRASSLTRHRRPGAGMQNPFDHAVWPAVAGSVQ